MIVFCTASNHYIFAGVRNELRQEAIAIGLAAMSTGKHVIVEVDAGMITALAITEFPIDN